MSMTITLNGEKLTFDQVSTVGDLLALIGLAGKPVVVELNQRALFPREVSASPIAEGDVIEIVQVTAGG
jgi:sulfur carrier protein